MNELQTQREQAIHLLRSGLNTQEVAQALNRSPQWVRKWRRRFEAEGWEGLAGRSRAPIGMGGVCRSVCGERCGKRAANWKPKPGVARD